MDSNSATTFILLLLLLLSAVSSSLAASANITTTLAKFPELASFNDLLTQTGVATMINSEGTVTVLAVDNSGIDAISGRPVNIVKRILSVHVILDYYDSAKLAKHKTAVLTTLFQKSGIAKNYSGFLNVTKLDDGMISFGSAVPGSGLGANLVKDVFTQNNNFAVLQVSDMIVPPGIDKIPNAPAPEKPAPAPSKSAPAPSKTAPAPASRSTAPSPASGKTNGPAAATPSKSAAPTPAKSAAPTADAPAADSPKAADAPAASSPAADSPTDQPSAVAPVATSAGVAMAVAAATFLFGP